MMLENGYLKCVLADLILGRRIHANAEEDADELANPPKVEDKLGAVPHGLSTDSDVVKRLRIRFLCVLSLVGFF